MIDHNSAGLWSYENDSCWGLCSSKWYSPKDITLAGDYEYQYGLAHGDVYQRIQNGCDLERERSSPAFSALDEDSVKVLMATKRIQQS